MAEVLLGVATADAAVTAPPCAEEVAFAPPERCGASGVCVALKLASAALSVTIDIPPPTACCDAEEEGAPAASNVLPVPSAVANDEGAPPPPPPKEVASRSRGCWRRRLVPLGAARGVRCCEWSGTKRCSALS